MPTPACGSWKRTPTMARRSCGLDAALALYRLGRARSATEALQSAHREMPRVTRYLLEKRIARPKLSEHGVSFDGDDRGWLYREDMRSTWAATPGALEWATKVLRRPDWSRVANEVSQYLRRRAHRHGLAWRPVLCDGMCGDLHMATNLSIDPKLIDSALKLSGEKTKRAAVTRALEEFIARRRQKRVLDLLGQLEWDKDFDHKAERTRR